jgi:hypothetical protein
MPPEIRQKPREQTGISAHDEHGSNADSTSVFEYRERLTSISAFSMPSAQASKGQMAS